MKIYVGADHAGFALKEKIIPFLRDLGYEVVDRGAGKFEAGDDYPDFSFAVAKEVAKNPKESRGLIFGGSGQGEAIFANRFPKVRAAVFYGPKKSNSFSDKKSVRPGDDIIRLSREHNDSNILCLGARFLSEEEAKTAVKQWLETAFSGEERHSRRIDKIDGGEYHM